MFVGISQCPMMYSFFIVKMYNNMSIIKFVNFTITSNKVGEHKVQLKSSM